MGNPAPGGPSRIPASRAITEPSQADPGPTSERVADPEPKRAFGPAPSGARRSLALVIATGLGSGYGPIAPGTFGSAAAVLLYLALAGVGVPLYLLAIGVVTGVGIWAADEAERIFQQKDDRRIVIDEFAGQLLTLAPLVILAPRVPLRSPFWVVTGFVLFRVLDVWKPGPARWAERNLPGGTGVVMDDAVAGVIGGILLGIAMLLVTP
jgi:phosphatidylglycerophosphatase A